MKEHPRLVAFALIGTVVALGAVYATISSPETSVVSPLEESAIEEDMATTTPELTAGETVSVTGAKGLRASVTGRTVSLTGPKDVEAKFDGCVYSVGWFGAGGNGLWIEWGDGEIAPATKPENEGQSCTKDVRSHTFSAAGTYTVLVRLWHPGPADESVTDCEDTVTVTVK